jgi:acetylornithine deacetylase
VIGALDNSASELLATLVGFDTTSAKSNLALIDFVRDFLARQGVTLTLTPSADGAKASLFASIGPKGAGGIGLSAHSDCVPVEGQSWTSDPFTLTPRGGKLYGRGTCDMKGFLACVLASVPRFKAAPLKEPIHILLSYDEEVGCLGVRPLIARFGQDLPRPRATIVGEPSGMEVIDAHKRIDAYATTVVGKEAHSSVPELGVNAITYAAELIVELLHIGDSLADQESDPRFDPPCSTVQAGTIRGGTAPNIVPKTCSFQWQVRSLPSAQPGLVAKRLADFAARTLLPHMRRVAPKASIETADRSAVPAFRAPAGSDAVALALQLTGSNRTRAVSYATEAGLFEAAGAPAVICGPGSVAQAHAADEFVSAEQLQACLAFLDRLTQQMSA